MLASMGKLPRRRMYLAGEGHGALACRCAMAGRSHTRKGLVDCRLLEGHCFLNSRAVEGIRSLPIGYTGRSDDAV